MHFNHFEEWLASESARELMGDYRVESVRKEFEVSQKFYVGERSKLVGVTMPTILPRLPYATTAFELQGPQNGRAFVVAWEADATRTALEIFVGGNWGYYDVGRVIQVRGSESFDIVGNAKSLRLASKTEEQASDLVQSIMSWVSKFLSVLNCVNVKTELIHAPAALNKKRARNGKPPLYSYHVLTLKRSAQRFDLGGTHASPRIHLRRGHIKHRKTGDFWWEPCVVGDRKRGVVMKDYDAHELAH